jgi:hypothetical protein
MVLNPQTSYAAGSDIEDDEQDPAYLLILAPTEPFVWQGLVMILKLPVVELSVQPQRIRLVADGTQLRLVIAKKLFTTATEVADSGVVTPNPNGLDEDGTRPVPLTRGVCSRAAGTPSQCRS